MTPRMRARRQETGATAVEFALVLPLLLFLVFGIVQYGLYFWATNATASAARETLRRAVVGDCQDSEELRAMVEDQVGGAGSVEQVNPDTWTDDWSTKGVGDQITLEVQVQSINLNFPFIPLPNDGLVTKTADGRLEDKTDSGVACT